MGKISDYPEIETPSNNDILLLDGEEGTRTLKINNLKKKILGDGEIPLILGDDVISAFDSIVNLLMPVNLWTGELGAWNGSVTGVQIPLEESFETFAFLRFYLWMGTNASAWSRPLIRDISVDQLKLVISRNQGTMSMCWGYGSNADYFDVQPTSTATKLIFNSNNIKVTKIDGYYI